MHEFTSAATASYHDGWALSSNAKLIVDGVSPTLQHPCGQKQDGIAALGEFMRADMSKIRNKSAYFSGVVSRFKEDGCDVCICLCARERDSQRDRD